MLNPSSFNKKCENREDCWDDDEQYHTLSLPESSVIFIEERDDYLEYVRKIKSPRPNPARMCTDAVGVDSEWKPPLGVHKERVSILQVATWDSIYIFDIIRLAEILSESDWLELIDGVFCNSCIIKLGFGLGADLKILFESLPKPVADKLSQCSSLLDLSSLSDKLMRHNPEIFPYDVSASGKGLADLVKSCVGFVLNKNEQLSNWEKRPLRRPQVLYAALDAYCLLEVCDILMRRADMLNIDLLSMMKSMYSVKRKEFRKQAKQLKTLVLMHETDKNQDMDLPKTSSQPVNIPADHATQVPEIAPGELAVVVDTMLQGLGRQLRMMGVDVKILPTNAHHKEALKISLQEKRIILTNGTPFKELSQYVAHGMCLNVGIGNARQQATEVLSYFNVRVHQDDVFSRCQVCNNGRYIEVPSETLKAMWLTDCLRPDLVNRDTPHQTAFKGGYIDLANLRTDTGAKLVFDGLSESVFNRVNIFYVCSDCGKVYWVGSHLQRVMKSLADMVITEPKEVQRKITPKL